MGRFHERCAGTVLALPRAVWNSWQPYLGGPKLQDDPRDQKLTQEAHPTTELPTSMSSTTRRCLLTDSIHPHGSSWRLPGMEQSTS